VSSHVPLRRNPLLGLVGPYIPEHLKTEWMSFARERAETAHVAIGPTISLAADIAVPGAANRLWRNGNHSLSADQGFVVLSQASSSFESPSLATFDTNNCAYVNPYFAEGCVPGSFDVQLCASKALDGPRDLRLPATVQ